MIKPFKYSVEGESLIGGQVKKMKLAKSRLPVWCFQHVLYGAMITERRDIVNLRRVWDQYLSSESEHFGHFIAAYIVHALIPFNYVSGANTSLWKNCTHTKYTGLSWLLNCWLQTEHFCTCGLANSCHLRHLSQFSDILNTYPLTIKKPFKI